MVKRKKRRIVATLETVSGMSKKENKKSYKSTITARCDKLEFRNLGTWETWVINERRENKGWVEIVYLYRGGC